MGDANKPVEETDNNDDIMDSDDLLDLDMPIDDPDDDHLTDALTESLEKDIEQLLERNEPERDETDRHSEPEAFTDPMNYTANTNSMETEPTPVPESAPIAAETQPTIPDVQQDDKKHSSGMANNLMLTLGLVAILVASLATWLGLDASGKISNLEKLHSRIQQQISELDKNQQQQHKALNNQVETMQQQIDALTKVVASKTTEQWRTAIEKETNAQKPLRPVAPDTGTVPDVKPTSKSKPTALPVIAKTKRTSKATTAITTVLSPANAVHTISHPAKPATASPSMGRHEVAPGSVKGWMVNIYSVESQNTAERKIRQLATKDIHAEYVRVHVKGKLWYRIRVIGFKDERAAIVFKKFLKEYHGIAGTWINKLK